MVGGPVPFNPQPPQNQNQNNTAPANVFAQMKAGTFAQNNDSEPQPGNRYDALRTNRESSAPHHHCWRTRPDFSTCSSDCPAYWMVPRPRRLWIVLITSHELVRAAFPLCSHSLFIGHRPLSILDTIDTLYIPPHTLTSCIQPLRHLFMAHGYGNGKVMTICWGVAKSPVRVSFRAKAQINEREQERKYLRHRWGDYPKKEIVLEQTSITGCTAGMEEGAGLACSGLLLGKCVHCRRIQDVVNHPDSSEESPDAVTDFRSHILAQQLRRVRVNCRHVPIELVVKSSQLPWKLYRSMDLPLYYPAW